MNHTIMLCPGCGKPMRCPCNMCLHTRDIGREAWSDDGANITCGTSHCRLSMPKDVWHKISYYLLENYRKKEEELLEWQRGQDEEGE